MKTIGLLGGMSWESSLAYYRIINETVRTRLGGLHSAKILMYSVDFAEIEPLQRQSRWDEATRLMLAAADRVEAGGADLLLICTNTMHLMAEAVEKHIHIPLLHIVDATAERIRAHGLRRVGLLGTRFTMEAAFYRDRLAAKHGLDVLTPDEADREVVHRVIYEELCRGEVRDSSRLAYTGVIERLVASGAEGVILGCTEIPLLIGDSDSAVPLFDTTTIHAQAAVDVALRS